MENTKIVKQDLIKILRKNRAKHVRLVAEATEGHRQKAVKFFAKNLARAKAGLEFETNPGLPTPREFTERYDDLISQLEMSVGDTIDLDSEDFGKYVLDKWDWKGVFESSNSVYFGKKHT